MKIPANKLMQRYLLTGAALGLYFGIFFRPVGDVREPNFFMPILLGILGGIVTGAVRVWQNPPFKWSFALQRVLSSVLVFTIFLIMLEFRHVADAFGGKPAVILLTTTTGAALGAFLANVSGAPDRLR